MKSRATGEDWKLAFEGSSGTESFDLALSNKLLDAMYLGEGKNPYQFFVDGRQFYFGLKEEYIDRLWHTPYQWSPKFSVES